MFNAIRTTFLLAVMTGLFMAVGFVVAGSFGMFFALALALITNLIAYWNSDKMVLRMQRARNLLLKTQWPISYIAHYVGYANVFTFSKRFKKSVGKPPREFREAKIEQQS